jgi:ribose transport system permease protein
MISQMGSDPEATAGVVATVSAHGRARRGPAAIHRAARTRLADSPEAGLALLLALVVAGFALADGDFASKSNLDAILRATAFVGIMAVGQTLLLVSGEFDLSVGSVASLGAVVGASLMTTRGWPWPLALVAVAAVGALTGSINGLLTAYARIPALVVTLGMLYIARGASLVVSDGLPVAVPDSYVHFGRAEPLLGLPWLVWIFLGLVLAGDFATWLQQSPANAPSPRHSAAVSPDPLGGVSLFGGAGTVVGALLGALLIQVIDTGLVVVGLASSWQPVATGALLVAAIAADGWRRRR